MATWAQLISAEMAAQGKSWADVVDRTISYAEMNVEFNDGYGGTYGKPFTVWTHKRVYFPAQYDGSEWVASVSRNPDGKPTRHVGAGG